MSQPGDHPSGAHTALESLYDRDGARAFRLAAGICLDLARCELAVLRAFSEAAAVHASGRRDLPTSWLLATVHRHATIQARACGQCSAAFAPLTEIDAEVLSLVRLGQLSCFDVAAHANVPAPVIKRLLRRALAALGEQRRLAIEMTVR